ncbi:carbohydrate ABC transporter substrate-binding protein, CUT1 family [Nakamurella panacisegetis]|uniref:Carbohydrate ABC transporter substrate-binding protein, CUT1 family n=1 Tax=Nakamurella panacisegetis TaxID=1090615 RepID=A0A1H0KDC1_9ACTN|nr:sugar ABC transporter substrate-binding protein [Nakamurella panacisegetis]SDO53761.1 carbohydrate ABC transporter substrate-binding protein, CUT1 family [Nakamurella panacisegetis]
MKTLRAHRASGMRTAALSAALIVAMPLALAACGSKSSASSSGGTPTVHVLDYYNEGNDNVVIGNTLTACGKANNITVVRDAVPGGGLIQKVLQESSSKTLPDVLMLDNPDMQQIAKSGALTPLSDYSISTDGYAPGILQAGTYNGKIYGLAPTVNSIALFYNKDVFTKAGITPPTTWADLRADAKKLTSGSQYGIALDANATYEGSWTFLPFMWSNGGSEKNINTPEVAEALQFWVDLMKDGSLSKGALNWTQADAENQFAAGKAAMMINGPWQFPALNAVKGLNYGVVSIPVNKAGQVAQAPLGGEVWTVPNTGNTENQKNGAKIVACMNSDANQIAMAVARGTVPSKTTLSTEFLKKAPAMAAFTKTVATARARTAILGDAWPKTATAIYTAVQSALTGQASPADALKTAASTVG